MHIIDTTGAGDCFTAAFAVAMLEGKADEDAMAWASKAAALCIQTSGAIPSMPTRAAMDRSLAGHGNVAATKKAEEENYERAHGTSHQEGPKFW